MVDCVGLKLKAEEFEVRDLRRDMMGRTQLNSIE